MDCVIYVAKIKALISFAIFAYAKIRFSHDAAKMLLIIPKKYQQLLLLFFFFLLLFFNYYSTTCFMKEKRAPTMEFHNMFAHIFRKRLLHLRAYFPR